MSIQDLIKTAVNMAVTTFKTDKRLFLLKDENSTEHLPFDAIEQEIEVEQVNKKKQTVIVSGKGFQIDQDTFKRLFTSCEHDLSQAVIVRYHDNKRQTWKLDFERPFDELIIGGLCYRFNTIMIKETDA